MQHIQLITFLSDFGTRDGYVGAVKGVIKCTNPNIEIIDITHDIKSYNIKMAAFAMLNYYSLFPEGTVHLAVVDPGVGSERSVIILVTKNYYFVGPDNGIFQFIAKLEEHKVFKVKPDSIYNNGKGSTFHARDVFAPIAAKIALGEHPQNIGTQIDGLQFRLTKTENTQRHPGTIQIDSITADKFGNIIFEYTKDDIETDTSKKLKSISFKNFESNQIYDYYSQVTKGKPLFLWNSLGYLELAVNENSAAEYFTYNNEDRAILIFKLC